MKKRKNIPTFLSEARVAQIKSNISEDIRMIEGADDRREDVGYFKSTAGMINKRDVVKRINKNKQLLKDHTPVKFTGVRADRAYNDWKKLRKVIKDNIMTKKQVHMPYPKESEDGVSLATAKEDTDFEEAVGRQRFVNDNIDRMVEVYRYLGARIDPDNPKMRSIEELRRRG